MESGPLCLYLSVWLQAKCLTLRDLVLFSVKWDNTALHICCEHEGRAEVCKCSAQCLAQSSPWMYGRYCSSKFEERVQKALCVAGQLQGGWQEEAQLPGTGRPSFPKHPPAPRGLRILWQVVARPPLPQATAQPQLLSSKVLMRGFQVTRKKQ